MRRLSKRLTYANVMSTIAVFLVVGGATAFAASQLEKNSVGTKQLKKNAVTAAKIKPGAVTLGKISASAQGALKGAQGPQGSQGPKGESGPRGPSDGFTSKAIGGIEIGSSEGASALIDALQLPPGSYLLSAVTALSNKSGFEQSAWCRLEAEGVEIGRTKALDEAPASQASASATVLGGVQLPDGGMVAFRCWANDSGVSVPEGSYPAMQAIAVETLHTD
jgi:hypothetical protein